MSSKKEILAFLETLPKETLQKLEYLSKTTLLPINHINSVDFARMVDHVFKSGGLADTYFPEWTDRTASDFGVFLVELFALFSDKDFFYINHFFREAHATTAEIYANLIHKAISNGIEPPYLTSSSGTASITFFPGAEEVVPRGSITLSVRGDNVNFRYTNEKFIIPENTVGQEIVDVPLHHGEIKEVSSVYNGVVIRINEIGVTKGSVRLTVDGDSDWEEVDSFADGTVSSKHFMVFYDQQSKAEIFFAKGRLGKVPAKETPYRVTYRVGGGEIGNILGTTINQVYKDSTDRKIVRFSSGDMLGGRNQMSIEELRQYVINRESLVHSTTSKADTTKLVEELDFVVKATAVQISNFIYIYAAPTDNGEKPSLSAYQINQIDNHIEKYKLWDYAYLVSSPAYVEFELGLTAYVTKDAQRENIRLLILTALQEYLDVQYGAEFGAGFRKSVAFKNIISKVPKVQNIEFTKLGVAGDVHESGPSCSAVPDIIVDEHQLMAFKHAVNNGNISIKVVGGID